MPTEIELKLLLDPADARRLQLQPLLRQATKRTSQILDNWYYDTPELAVRHNGIALRIRRQGRQRLQTIKLSGKVSSTSGLSIRPEWETPYQGDFDFSVIGIPHIVDWLQQPEIRNRIGPLFRTRFRRITWHLPVTSGGEVLLALDRGEVSCGARTVPLCELELELSGNDDPAHLMRIADQLGAKVSLRPGDLSKAQRGYDLIASVTRTPSTP